MKSFRMPLTFAVPLLALLVSVAHARDLPEVKPAAEGFSAERLARIDGYMEKAVKDGVMVGGQGLIARNGNIVYNETWGDRDREKNLPMEEDTIHRIYSMTKPITGVALMILYEEGKFLLNEPVAKYLPELANLQVALSTADGGVTAVSDGTQSSSSGAGDTSVIGKTRAPARQPTIRDLMTHTAGFTYGVFGDTEVDNLYREARILQHPDLTDFVTKLGKIPLQYEPGTRWHYSISVDVQGALVERLAGMSFGEFLQTRLFKPLGMDDTSFVVPKRKLKRLAQLYTQEGTPGEMGTAFRTEVTSTKLVPAPEGVSAGYMEGATFEGGGGGLVSTTSDYLKFCQMMLNGGQLNGARILSRNTVALMSRDHLGEIQMGFGRAGVGFGLDFAVVEDAGLAGESGSDGEYNWGGAAGTRFWIDPKENVIGIFMVQSIPHRTTLASHFKNLAYQAMETSRD